MLKKRNKCLLALSHWQLFNCEMGFFFLKHMNINISTNNIELTSSLKEFTEKKIKSCSKFIDSQEVTIEVEIGQDVRSQRKGDVFKARAYVDVFKQRVVAEERSDDLYTAISNMKDDLERQLKNLKGKISSIRTRENLRTKKDSRFDDAARFNRSGRIRDEGM